MFAPGKYKPGMFIKTPFGRMRVKKDEYLPCEKCTLYTEGILNENCVKFGNMHNSSCAELISYFCYLEKV